MKIVIRAATISDVNSPHHQKKRNILVHNGHIKDISTRPLSADRVIDAKGMIISTGWFDIGTFVGDPGLEYKEDIDSVTKAAVRGGFTDIAVLPNTEPSIQSKNEVNYITKGNNNRLVQIHPMASVTLQNQGRELTDMMDLHEAGAIAFTDGLNSVWNTDILLKSLQYLQSFDGLLINRPEDIWLTQNGQMNEGINSVRLGLKGIPKIAEDIVVSRDIELLRYAGGRLHFTKISSPKTIDLIRKAKKSGLQNISCDIASYQALLNDSLLENFDTNYKTNPPLREKSDLKAIVAGLKDDTIDILTSGHLPQDIESKVTEFDQADFGIINLQTFASQIAQLSKLVDIDELIQKVTVAPRKLLRREIPVIDINTKASLTLFDPHEEWVFTKALNHSISENSPWLEQQLQGRVKATFNNTKHWIDV